MNTIVRWFPETHLGNGHKGLEHIALKKKINVKNLGQGEFVVFTNRKLTGLKMFASGNKVVCYYRNAGQRLDLDTIRLLPKYFNGSELDYPGALKEVLEKKLRRKND